MPTGEISFHVLDVGQGACNYVEIRDTTGAVTHNMLIDLGTNSQFAIATANVQWLIGKIEANNNYLDLLLLTHGDTDHYNLVSRLLPAFGEPDHDKIGLVRYGGPRWRYGRGALITTLTAYTADIGGFAPCQSSFDPNTEAWAPIWPAVPVDGEPRLQLILADTPHPHDPSSMYETPRRTMNAEAINSKSVVTALQWDDYWILATGDATSTTLAAINEHFELAHTDDYPTTFMLTLPHHGSRKTTYDLKRANDLPDFDARWAVSDFLDLFKPITISISAGEKRHHHPSLYMIRQFADALTNDGSFWDDPVLNDGDHFLTSWIDIDVTPGFIEPAWPPKWQYATTKTKKNIYGTFYFKADQYNSAAYPQFIAPPLPSMPASQKERVVGVPRGRNYEFILSGAAAVSVRSSENGARNAVAEGAVRRSVPARPKGAFTISGRAQRSTTGGW
ncbi:MBL fold metallo-hydrolase [Aestuariivita sp.]|jgi:hypothetical protein|uniref:MBL fold metallo-hydrolase n=1 Tax=Aestuariivita sp. TaxID=1872407 RepID=UPI00217083FB|nr:MBL fold metallo-hydrolase [Aestuariivita sp.]MCE8005943.1 MBL fold metallo-hydrolase [Aestuariivita sp.]